MGIDASKYMGEGNTTDLKAKDFIGKTMKLLISRVEEVTYEAKDDQPEQRKLALHFQGKEKRLVLNIPNTEYLINSYGSDTDGWNGKEIQITTKDYTDKGFGHGWVVTPLLADYDDDIPF